ncbi:MAG: hypothetical protein JRC92_11995 [Deltaproteobacteria bacterium]|nr:hypothetical protein [Deltaproteobacteria bacterium]
MLDFWPQAIHHPFSAPEPGHSNYPEPKQPNPSGPLKIIHATNHPGIDGTRYISAAVDNLIKRGYEFDFVCQIRVPMEEYLTELTTAHMSVGKMKMGYYASAQIESMFYGVPAVTYVRPELQTEEIKESGLILTDLEGLEATLEHYITHPDALEAKRRIARSSILAIHDNDELSRRLIGLYRSLTGRTRNEAAEAGPESGERGGGR